MKEQKEQKNNKRRFSKPVIFVTAILQFALSIAICVALIFYSPFFKTIEKYVVSSLMETGSHQYIAKLFLSEAQIKELTGSTQGTSKAVPQKLTTVKVINTGNTNINKYHVSGSQFDGYVLAIKDPLRVKVGMTQYVGKVGEFTSKIAERFGAVAAINGGGFSLGVNSSDSAQYPTNFVMHDGSVVWQDSRFDDDTPVNVIALDKSGILVVGNHSINGLKKLNVSEAVTMPKNSQNDFKPFIVNGEGQFSKGSSESRAPRTSIAQLEDGTILLIALDGRQVGQLGATYYEMQQLIINFSTSDNPVETATILDGGGSTTMYYNGEVINHPSAQFGERTVATAFYVEK